MSSKPIDDKDRLLFRATVGNVKPLKTDKVHLGNGEKPKPVPRRFAHHLDHHHLSDRVSHAGPALNHDDTVSYVANGIRHDVLKSLRKGLFDIDAELDLHGQTIREAKQTLLQFLQFSTRQNLRCIHIIHGKGYRSPDNYPRLKNKLDGWLRQHPDILAFCTSTPADGGTGAIYVLLRIL